MTTWDNRTWSRVVPHAVPVGEAQRERPGQGAADRPGPRGRPPLRSRAESARASESDLPLALGDAAAPDTGPPHRAAAFRTPRVAGLLPVRPDEPPRGQQAVLQGAAESPRPPSARSGSAEPDRGDVLVLARPAGSAMDVETTLIEDSHRSVVR
ncbi:hypothetical protein SNE510_63530 [Streptomyces sp. NE5-10]|nr:hypothetical protein SNE510_63530 [Streptomyces sp. NE5-10]